MFEMFLYKGDCDLCIHIHLSSFNVHFIKISYNNTTLVINIQEQVSFTTKRTNFRAHTISRIKFSWGLIFVRKRSPP